MSGAACDKDWFLTVMFCLTAGVKLCAKISLHVKSSSCILLSNSSSCILLRQMYLLSILLPNSRLLNLGSWSFSMRRLANNLLPLLKLVQCVLVFHCICTNRINGSVNQCSEIISAFSNGLHTFGRDPDAMSCATGPFSTD